MTTLIIFYLITLLFSSLILYICHKKIKTDKTKELILRIITISTVVLHYSDLIYLYLTTGKAEVNSSHLFAIYPCHIMMWISFIYATCVDKESKLGHIMADFMFYVGFFCGTIGIVVNEIYLSTPDLTDYTVLKGLLSHSTLLLGCLYVFVMKYVKVNTLNNLKSTVYGLIFFIVQGVLMINLFRLFDLGDVNAMYLLEPPFEDLPFINTFTIGIAGVVMVIIISTILEFIFLPKEEVTILKLFNKGDKKCTNS